MPISIQQLIKRSYVPSRDSFDASRWTTVGGTPSVLSQTIVLTQSIIEEKSSISRGYIRMKYAIPSIPSTGNYRRFGLKDGTGESYALFVISGTDFTAETRDADGNTNSIALSFDSAWAGVNTTFEILAFGSQIKFRIKGSTVAEFGGLECPNQPMSLYIENGNADSMVFYGYDFEGYASDLSSNGGTSSSVTIGTAPDSGIPYPHYQSNSFASAVVKDSPGRVYSVSVINTTGSDRYIQLHNLTAALSGNEVAQYKQSVPANGGVIIGQDMFGLSGMEFDNGIVVANSSTAATYTAGSAGDLLVDIMYDGEGGVSGTLTLEDIVGGLLLENSDLLALED